MPVYEFKCAKCGTTFEKLVLSSDSNNLTCSNCGSSDVKKLFSSFGFSSSGRTSTASNGCGGCTSSSCLTCGK